MEDLFFAALDKNSASERATFLESACAGDTQLRRQVEKLLDAHPNVGDFLKRPAGELLPDDGDLDFLQPSTRPDSLGRLGHYEVLEVLGKGGFGTVYRAFDDVLQRVVAVKVLAPQLAATSPARKRFLQEARSSAQVRHENVVQVHAVEESPLPHLVMELIPGETLQQHLNRTGPLEVSEVLRIGRQIAEGLAAAHACDLIHRDIKPGNVLLEGGSQHVKITDFGLARAADDASVTQSGMIAGTPMFMSPQQALGHKIDRRTDLFSLGSVLYQMVSGRPPFRAPTALAVLKRVAEEPPRPIPEIIPETPDWLCAIITKLHAKNPDDRYQSAREVADVLADYEARFKAHQKANDVLPAVPAAAAVPPASTGSTGRKWLAAATVLLLSAIALAAAELAGVTHLFRSQATFDPIQPESHSTPLAVAKHEAPVPAAVPEPPPFAIGPFSAAGARQLQEAWATYLTVPLEAENKVGMTLILIPPASVKQSQAYYLGKYEVTQGEWEQVMGYNRSGFGPQNNPEVAGQDTGKFPVERVSWYDCVEFCNRLSEREGLKPYYELTVTKRVNKKSQIDAAEVKIIGGNGYRLPTDAEWTHACAAGAKSTFHFGDKDEQLAEYAWFTDNSDRRTHAVGEKKPNAFGLYDTHGNVQEWIEKMREDAESGGSKRICCGGAWSDAAVDNAVDSRSRREPAHRSHFIGLRVARGAP